MRVEASKILAQTVKDRNPDDHDTPQIPAGLTRSTKIAEVQQAALDFAAEFLDRFEFPSLPKLRVGNVRGFEDVHKAFIEIVGVVIIQAEFNTLNNRAVRMDLAIPLYKGEFQQPSIVYYKDRKQVFSQDFIDQIMAGLETKKPVLERPMTSDQSVHHEMVVQRPLFGAPIDPTEWSMLMTDRY
jgi:hypothetical protein